MKAYKIVITIVSILLATIAVVFLILNSPATLFSYQGGPTRNDYQTLEKYSVKLVKNDNFELDEDINVEKSISKDYIIVKLDKPFYGIEAKFPMIKGFIMFPFFVLLQVPLDITSLFIREVKWRKIPHGVSKKK